MLRYVSSCLLLFGVMRYPPIEIVWYFVLKTLGLWAVNRRIRDRDCLDQRLALAVSRLAGCYRT